MRVFHPKAIAKKICRGNTMNLCWALASLLLFAAMPALADGPKDNIPDKVRRIPPPGIKVPDADRQELQAALAELAKKIDGLKTSLKAKPAVVELLPDVQIYH